MGSIPTRSRHPGRSRRRPAPVRRCPAHPRRRPRLLRRGAAGLAAALLVLGPGLGTAEAQEPDTARAEAAAPAEPDTAPGPPVTPLGAFARSVVLPGWGQAEVDQPFRGGIYFVAQAASLWMVLKSQAKLSAARRAAGPGASDDPLVESRTAQRENWIVLSAFIALASGVDAWVATHLHDFEGELEPPEDGTAGAQIRYSVPLALP